MLGNDNTLDRWCMYAHFGPIVYGIYPCGSNIPNQSSLFSEAGSLV